MKENTVKSVIKILIEENKDIKKFNIAQETLNSSMEELVIDYINEGNYNFAFKAAIIEESEKMIRKVFDAIKNKIFTVNIVERSLFLKIALLAGTDKELKKIVIDYEKESSSYLDLSKIIDICEKIPEGDKLLFEFGERLTKKYILEELEYKSPNSALRLLQEAKRMGYSKATYALINFGDEPFLKKKLSVSYPYSIIAYELAGTPESFKKAAEGYLNIGREKKAARIFKQIGDDGEIQNIIVQIIKSGRFSDAMNLRSELFENQPLEKEMISFYFGVAIASAKRKVVEKIEKYLVSKNTDNPFPTGITFWHFSQENNEWDGYLKNVFKLAGKINYGYPYEPIAKDLYLADETKEKIEEIFLFLQEHLLIGYMLSALTLEVSGKHSEGRREYEHPFDAAFRTFSHGVNRYDGVEEKYNPFNKNTPNFKKDSDVMNLYKELSLFEKKIAESKAGKKHSYESDLFLKNSDEVRKETQDYYKRITNKIRILLNHL